MILSVFSLPFAHPKNFYSLYAEIKGNFQVWRSSCRWSPDKTRNLCGSLKYMLKKSQDLLLTLTLVSFMFSLIKQRFFTFHRHKQLVNKSPKRFIPGFQLSTNYICLGRQRLIFNLTVIIRAGVFFVKVEKIYWIVIRYKKYVKAYLSLIFLQYILQKHILEHLHENHLTCDWDHLRQRFTHNHF